MKKFLCVFCALILQTSAFAKYSELEVILKLDQSIKSADESCLKSKTTVKEAIESAMNRNGIKGNLDVVSKVLYARTTGGGSSPGITYAAGCTITMQLDTEGEYALSYKKQKVKMKFLTVKERREKIANSLQEMINENLKNKGLVYQETSERFSFFGLFRGALLKSIYIVKEDGSNL